MKNELYSIRRGFPERIRVRVLPGRDPALFIPFSTRREIRGSDFTCQSTRRRIRVAARGADDENIARGAAVTRGGAPTSKNSTVTRARRSCPIAPDHVAAAAAHVTLPSRLYPGQFSIPRKRDREL